MNKSRNLILFSVLIMVILCAAAVQPQLSMDEQNAIVEAVVQTMNPDAMKATVVAEVEADLIRKFTEAGYVGLAGALALSAETDPVMPGGILPQATSTPDAIVHTVSTAAPTQAGPRVIETNIAEYYNGAVLQADGTYRGLHAKQVSAYAYTVGEDEDGIVKQFHTEYTPNTLFNVDVVFENDGSLVWPPRIEMRWMDNVGEYTGHSPSVFIDRTDNPVMPGDQAAFTVSAYGSENLGWTTFYFQLFDADSGSVIEGGQGSFTYHAI